MDEDDRNRLRAMLESADWTELTTRLIAYARFCLAREGRRAGPHGTTPEQFVMRGVKDVLGGTTYEPILMRSLFDIVAARVAYLIYVDVKPK
jgi:hypothetical protein